MTTGKPHQKQRPQQQKQQQQLVTPPPSKGNNNNNNNNNNVKKPLKGFSDDDDDDKKLIDDVVILKDDDDDESKSSNKKTSSSSKKSPSKDSSSSIKIKSSSKFTHQNRPTSTRPSGFFPLLLTFLSNFILTYFLLSYFILCPYLPPTNPSSYTHSICQSITFLEKDYVHPMQSGIYNWGLEPVWREVDGRWGVGGKVDRWIEESGVRERVERVEEWGKPKVDRVKRKMGPLVMKGREKYVEDYHPVLLKVLEISRKRVGDFGEKVGEFGKPYYEIVEMEWGKKVEPKVEIVKKVLGEKYEIYLKPFFEIFKREEKKLIKEGKEKWEKYYPIIKKYNDEYFFPTIKVLSEYGLWMFEDYLKPLMIEMVRYGYEEGWKRGLKPILVKGWIRWVWPRVERVGDLRWAKKVGEVLKVREREVGEKVGEMEGRWDERRVEEEVGATGGGGIGGGLFGKSEEEEVELEKEREREREKVREMREREMEWEREKVRELEKKRREEGDLEEEDLDDFIASLRAEIPKTTASLGINVNDPTPTASSSSSSEDEEASKPLETYIYDPYTREEVEELQSFYEVEIESLGEKGREILIERLREVRLEIMDGDKDKDGGESVLKVRFENKIERLDEDADKLAGKLSKYFLKTLKEDEEVEIVKESDEGYHSSSSSSSIEEDLTKKRDSKIQEAESLGNHAIEKVRKMVEEVKGEIESFERELREREMKAVEEVWDPVDDMVATAQGAVAPKWAWLRGVTYKDWQRYHGYRRSSQAWKTEYEGLVNGTVSHKSLRKLDIYDHLSQLSFEAEDLLETFTAIIQKLLKRGTKKLRGEFQFSDITEAASEGIAKVEEGWNDLNKKADSFVGEASQTVLRAMGATPHPTDAKQTYSSIVGRAEKSISSIRSLATDEAHSLASSAESVYEMVSKDAENLLDGFSLPNPGELIASATTEEMVEETGQAKVVDNSVVEEAQELFEAAPERIIPTSSSLSSSLEGFTESGTPSPTDLPQDGSSSLVGKVEDGWDKVEEGIEWVEEKVGEAFGNEKEEEKGSDETGFESVIEEPETKEKVGNVVHGEL